MFEVIFLCVLALIWIIFATIQDLKTREIANWLNFSLIVFALGFRFFYSLFFSENFLFFYEGLIGLGIFFIIGNLFYYGRIFAGGDAKLLIALGAVLPFSTDFLINIRIFVWFFILFLFAGAVYGFFWSLILASKHFNNFKKEFSKRVVKSRKIICSVMFFGLVFIVLGFVESLLFILGIFIFLIPYFYVYAKAVDEACMIKKIKSNKLAEGDWLYKNVKVGKKMIKVSWGGLTKEDIKLIKKKHKSILIRQGIPFTPAFLISFVILILFWFLKGL